MENEMEWLAMLSGGWAIIWTIAVFAVLVGTVENEFGFVSLIVLVVGLIVLELTGATAVTTWAMANPVRFVGLAALYLLAGAAWALFKWWRYANRHAGRVKTAFAEWQKSHANSPREEFFDSHYHNPLSLTGNRDRIIVWMAWWVPSLFWALVSDLVIGIWNRLYDMLSGAFGSVMRRVVNSAIDK